jgi:hypothetical protein
LISGAHVFGILSLLLLALLWQKDSMDVGEDATVSNGDGAKQLAELLVVPDGKLDVARDYAVLLVVTGRVSS